MTQEITKWASHTGTKQKRPLKKAQPTITSAPAIIPPKKVSGSSPTLITTIVHDGKPFEVDIGIRNIYEGRLYTAD
jgi:hypothetical protein